MGLAEKGAKGRKERVKQGWGQVDALLRANTFPLFL